jgi:hypothetical protein
MSAGFRHDEQIYNQKVTQILVFFMTTGVLSLLIPVSRSWKAGWGKAKS